MKKAYFIIGGIIALFAIGSAGSNHAPSSPPPAVVVAPQAASQHVVSQQDVATPTPTPATPTAVIHLTPKPTPLPTPIKTPTPTPIPTAGPTALCRDGTYSYSKTRSGTCSHHGGVAEWL